MGFYTVQRDLYGTIDSSTATSGITSETYWVGDARDLSLHIVGSPSTTTLQGSNDDGRSAAISNWATLQTITTAGLYEVQVGFRWLRCQRSETTNVLVNLRCPI